VDAPSRTRCDPIGVWRAPWPTARGYDPPGSVSASGTARSIPSARAPGLGASCAPCATSTTWSRSPAVMTAPARPRQLAREGRVQRGPRPL